MKGKKDRFVKELAETLEYGESVRAASKARQAAYEAKRAAMSKTKAKPVSNDTEAEVNAEPSEVQPTAVLAQVGVMPDGHIQVAVAQEVTERVAFCLEVSRQFLLLAGQQYAAEKTKKGPEIVVAPPGMRVQ